MNAVHARPAEGRRVRDPETGMPLPQEGAVVPRTTYWVRLEAAGDVLLEPVLVATEPPVRGGGEIR